MNSLLLFFVLIISFSINGMVDPAQGPKINPQGPVKIASAEAVEPEEEGDEEEFEEAVGEIEDYDEYIDSLIETFPRDLKKYITRFITDKKDQFKEILQRYDQSPRRKRAQETGKISIPDTQLLQSWVCANINQAVESRQIYIKNLNKLQTDKNKIIENRERLNKALQENQKTVKLFAEQTLKGPEQQKTQKEFEEKIKIQARRIVGYDTLLKAYEKLISFFAERIHESVPDIMRQACMNNKRQYATSIKWLAEYVDPIFRYNVPAENATSAARKFFVSEEQLQQLKSELQLYEKLKIKKYSFKNLDKNNFEQFPFSFIDRIINAAEYVLCNDSIRQFVKSLAQDALNALLVYERPQSITIELDTPQKSEQDFTTIDVQLSQHQINRIKTILQNCGFKFAGIQQLQKWQGLGMTSKMKEQKSSSTNVPESTEKPD